MNYITQISDCIKSSIRYRMNSLVPYMIGWKLQHQQAFISNKKINQYFRTMKMQRALSHFMIFSSLTIILLFGIIKSHAQDNPSPRALELARELITITLENDLSRRMIEEGWRKTETILRKKNPQITNEDIAELKTEYIALQVALAEELVKNAAPIYTQFLTVDELNDILTFQKSLAGQKMINIMPQIMNKVMPQIIAETRRSGPLIEGLFNEAVQKRGLKIY